MKRPWTDYAVLAALALASPAVARADGASWPAGVDLSRGFDIDEAYRDQVHLCDTQAEYAGADPTFRRSCRGDPNRVTALRRLPSGAIAYVSKLAIDFDGSPLACGPNHDRSDQCGTSLMLRDAGGVPTPVNADRIPYVVIPRRGAAEGSAQFSQLTGVRVGDFGVVIWRGRVVPVIVADTGPYDRLGEGSLALHRALGHEQCAVRDAHDTCTQAKFQLSIESDVVTVLVPGTARTDLTPENLAAVVRSEGARLWAAHQAEVTGRLF